MALSEPGRAVAMTLVTERLWSSRHDRIAALSAQLRFTLVENYG